MKLLTTLGTQQDKARKRIILENILLTVDSSPSSKIALSYGLKLARHFDAKIYVVPGVPMVSAGSVTEDAQHGIQDEARSFADKYAHELLLSGTFEGVRHEILAGGEGKKAIPSLLQTQEFDLVISGVAICQGQAIRLEPTIEEVVRKWQCPLFNVGPEFRNSAEIGLKHILFATDFSPESLEASRYALFLAQEFQARLTLMHVVEGFEPTLLDQRVLIAKPYELWLGKLVPDEAQLWCEVDRIVEFGRAGERILQVAWENHADLIVVGARGLDRVTSPGLNVSKLLCNAWCPVLTVSGAPETVNQERFWRAAAAASESLKQELVMQSI